jgi:hypothetical protein
MLLSGGVQQKSRADIYCRIRYSKVTAFLAARLLRCRLGFGGFFHMTAQTERTHVGPHLFYIIKTFLFHSLLAVISPSQRIAAISGPNGVLLFMFNTTV